MIKRCLLFGLFIQFGLCLFAQKEKTISLKFNTIYGNNSFKLGENYKVDSTNTLKINTFRFYVSAINLVGYKGIVFEEKNSFHLIDCLIDSSSLIQFKVPIDLKFIQVMFSLGIDSTTNVSGAMGGDLDPTKGMYWTWQSGYINFKLEGESTLCKTRKNEFHFHLGGYEYPFNALQNVFLNVHEQENITINVDLAQFMNQINLSKENTVMSPSENAVKLSKQAVSIFSVKQE